ncbi:hypothetical protein [Brumicola nitratireducens]|uniref:Heparinase II/III-like protein n=1 Tax=Glaciecola nitratireducens (strain JCM 12485 / KCTC 12276 / FR1064) TaxID=1085623 RepID=G4QI37_GLANF|nr:hypothetical protein [Glaciecola nitratireducens]AEP30651.1 hypothetical protein GNIT_2554 [Glaciecola nitratireducens FR1064]
MKKISIFLLVIFILLSLVAGGAIGFLMRHYNYTLYEVVNKSAVKLGVVEEQQRLISYEKQYENTYGNTYWQNSNESKLFPFLSSMNQPSVKRYFLDRLSILKKQRAMGYSCDNANQFKLLIVYYCSIEGEIEESVFLNLVLNYSFEVPREVGSYGNALTFVIAYELLKYSFDISKDNEETLQSILRNMLGSYLSKLDGDSASLFHGRSVLASNAIILASQLDGSSLENKALVSRAVGHYQDFYQALKKVEIWPEGYNYWINSRALPIVMALEAFKYAVVDNIQSTKDIEVLQQRIGLWHIYNTRPDWTIQGWGDEGPRVDLKDETSKVIDYLALVTNSPEIDSYASLLVQRFGSRAYWRGYKMYLPIIASDMWFSENLNIMGNKDVTLEPLSHLLPLSEIFGRGYSNHVVIRSGWGPKDTFIQFRASQMFTHHQHNDAGHFTLFKNAPLIVNSSAYSGMNTENRMYFASRSIAKNTIKVMNPNETFKPSRQYSIKNADGGQRIPIGLGSSVKSFQDWQDSFDSGKYHKAELLKYEIDSQNNVSLSVDLTNAYNSIKFSTSSDDTKVSRVTRNFAYISAADSVLIFDQVLTTSTELPSVNVIFFSERPTLFGSEVTRLGKSNDGITMTNSRDFFIEQGDASLSVAALSSIDFGIMLIGGPTYRNFVRNTPSLDTPIGSNFDGGYEVKPWNDKSDWRLEIPFAINGKKASSLTILRPGSFKVPKLIKIATDFKLWIVEDFAIVSILNNHNNLKVIDSIEGATTIVFVSEKAGEAMIFEENEDNLNVTYTEGITIINRKAKSQ